MILEEFETVMEGGEGGAAPAAEAAPEPAAESAEPTGEPTAEPAGEPEQPAAYTPTLEDLAWELAPVLREMGFGPPAQAPAQAPGPQGFPPQFAPQPGQPGFDWSGIDPYSDEFGSALGNGIRYELKQAIDGAIGPVTQSLESAREAEVMRVGNERAQDMLADEVARNGDFSTVEREDGSTHQPGRDLARNLAEQFMPAAEERYGTTSRAAEAAIAAAAQVVRDVEKAAAQAAVKQHMNRNAELAGAQGEPSPSGMATGMQGQPAGIPDPATLARKYAATS